jgi:hypothetical protein
MVLLYILLIAYIVAINFYAFLQVKSMRDQELEASVRAEVQANAAPVLEAAENNKNSSATENKTSKTETLPDIKPSQRNLGKLFITAALGGAITIYVCMFIFKYKRSDLLLMVLMPLLGVLNVYLWVILFRSGFSFFLIR